MRVEFLDKYAGHPEGRLRIDSSAPHALIITHYNEDDFFYKYQYKVIGTSEEIIAIREFCEGVNHLYEEYRKWSMSE